MTIKVFFFVSRLFFSRLYLDSYLDYHRRCFLPRIASPTFLAGSELWGHELNVCPGTVVFDLSNCWRLRLEVPRKLSSLGRYLLLWLLQSLAKSPMSTGFRCWRLRRTLFLLMQRDLVVVSFRGKISLFGNWTCSDNEQPVGNWHTLFPLGIVLFRE